MAQLETREFFNREWKQGLLTDMVLAAHERERNVVPQPEQLAVLFSEAFQLPGFASLVRCLVRHPAITCIGNSCISVDSDYTDSFELSEFHVGITEIGLTPLQHMHHLASLVGQIPEEVVSVLDTICLKLSTIDEEDENPFA